ncbi:protein YgfX [Vibrio sp. JPW-9-11-11]|uniref:protein YgfX n=1 Tax=Vibrio sp. JPW-9-11-11 TaxID=1416532 RepID=UPI001592E42B|nr:protein YgfX [Vibrio sp. JPW-9-11-11]
MSLITSAKCVRFVLTPSKHANQANGIFSVLACLATMYSPLPIIAYTVLLPLIVKLHQHQIWLAPALQGEVTFVSPRQIETLHGTYQIKAVLFPLMSWAIVLILHNNQRILLWRDSLSDASYRQIVVLLKREH